MTLLPFTSSASGPPRVAAIAAVGTDVQMAKAFGHEGCWPMHSAERTQVALIGVVGDIPQGQIERLARGGSNRNSSSLRHLWPAGAGRDRRESHDGRRP